LPVPRATMLTICVGQIEYSAMRDHRKRDAVRARMWKALDAGNQQQDAAPAKIYAMKGVPGDF